MYAHLLKNYDPTNYMPEVKDIVGGATSSIWFNGCSKRCEGCWNEVTWTRNKNLYLNNDDVIDEILLGLDEYFPKHLALLGGDPLEASFLEDYKNNIEDTYYILKKIKERRPETKVICWTGYTWEECMNIPKVKKVMSEKLIDVLIDGRFEINKKIENKLYGSSNQKVINVKDSILTDSIITYKL